MNNKIIDKNYGSIPHLSTSKLTQQADKKIHAGQEKILTEKTRDKHDLVIVTEKIDGSNVGIIKKNGELKSITRSGYEANTSRFRQHIIFEEYLKLNYDKYIFLPDDWRIAGEWCIQAHGTIYDINNLSPFVAFDIFDENNTRLNYEDFDTLCYVHNIDTVPLLHVGEAISIDECIKLLGTGKYGNPDKPEGFVTRCERNGKVDFLAKWVRSDKEDGKYMKEEIYNKNWDWWM